MNILHLQDNFNMMTFSNSKTAIKLEMHSPEWSVEKMSICLSSLHLESLLLQITEASSTELTPAVTQV